MSEFTLRKCDFTDDWYALQRDGRDAAWALPEGPLSEWLEIAAAIKAGESKRFTRCCVNHGGSIVPHFVIYSPRNSRGTHDEVVLTLDEANAFADSVTALARPATA